MTRDAIEVFYCNHGFECKKCFGYVALKSSQRLIWSGATFKSTDRPPQPILKTIFSFHCSARDHDVNLIAPIAMHPIFSIFFKTIKDIANFVGLIVDKLLHRRANEFVSRMKIFYLLLVIVAAGISVYDPKNSFVFSSRFH